MNAITLVSKVVVRAKSPMTVRADFLAISQYAFAVNESDCPCLSEVQLERRSVFFLHSQRAQQRAYLVFADSDKSWTKARSRTSSAARAVSIVSRHKERFGRFGRAVTDLAASR